MAFTYGFYNAIDHDRTYSATQFGEMFDGLINDGVYSTIGECFMTVPGSGVGVVVKSGRAWFNKTWSVNTADLPLDLGLPDLLLPRIDSVILEVDTRVAVRANAIKVVKGYPAVDPVPPGLTTNDGLYQYPLAYVKVAANATQITKSDITVVVGQTPCPFVTAILQSVPIDDMYQQWEGQFEEWFADVKSQLSGDIAGNLLHRIELVENRVDVIEGKEVEEYDSGNWHIRKYKNGYVDLYYSEDTECSVSWSGLLNSNEICHRVTANRVASDNMADFPIALVKICSTSGYISGISEIIFMGAYNKYLSGSVNVACTNTALKHIFYVGISSSRDCFGSLDGTDLTFSCHISGKWK